MTLEETKKIRLLSEVRLPQSPSEKFRNSDIYASEVPLAKNPNASDVAYKMSLLATSKFDFSEFTIPI